MSELILLYIYNSNIYTNNELLSLIKNIKGISIIDTKISDRNIEISNQGNFIIYYKGQSKNYEANEQNLSIIIKILNLLNIV